jgi:hypothetical protein
MNPRHKLGCPCPWCSPPHGEATWCAKLTSEQAREIRASKEKLRELAQRYGVSETVISGIRNGYRWKHA